MPSGAKKRKAAKKKMKTQPAKPPNPSNSTHTNGDDVNHGNDRENDDVGGKQVEYESNGKGEQIEISESRKTGKSTDGGSSESSSGGSSDNESHASEISSTKVDDSTAGGVHMSGKEPGVPVVKIPSIEQIEPAYISSSPDIKETVSERTTNDQVILSVEETTVISQPKECLTENDSRSIHLCNVAGANPDGVVEDVKDVGVTEPLLKPNLHPMEQKTTWKSCCGLFELFGK